MVQRVVPDICDFGRLKALRDGFAATSEDALGFGAARIVIATGAHWVGDGSGAMGPDTVPGVDAALADCVTPEQFFAGKPIGERVVILDADGYFMAIGIAEALADRGKRVTIVTQLEKVTPMTDLTLEGYNLKRMMRAKGIAERPGH